VTPAHPGAWSYRRLELAQLANHVSWIPRSSSRAWHRVSSTRCSRSREGHAWTCTSQARGPPNPWQSALNARLSWAFPTISGHALEIAADMLNVLNFINSG